MQPQEGDFIPGSITERAPEGYQQGKFGQIHEIRQGEARCNTCGRPASAPFRRYAEGKIVAGCVDDFHTGHLVTPSASSFWHNRPEAKKIRQQRLADRKARGEKSRKVAA